MSDDAREIDYEKNSISPLKGKNIIAIISGCKGCGKTWFAVTLAHALSLYKKRILVFDADNGINNTKVQLGFDFCDDLDTVIYGTKSLNQITSHYEKGHFDIITGNPTSAGLATMSVGRLQIFGDDLDILSQNYDKTILDISTGYSNATNVLTGLAQEVILICSTDLKQLEKNYEIIRMIANHHPRTKIDVVINQVNSIEEGQRIYKVLEKVCEKYVSKKPELLGIIRQDTRVRDSIRNQSTIITRYPESEAALDVIKIAQRMLQHG